MERCPNDPTAATCGLVAAERLAESRQLVLMPDMKNDLVLSAPASIFEVLDKNEVRVKTFFEDEVEFACVACSKAILIVHDTDTEEFRVESNPS